MANLVDQSGDAQSNIVQGIGTNSVSFTMPGSVALNVESVLAHIDNTLGADTTATLTIRDVSGEVIATKRQDDVIPAADTGTATFALRLDSGSGGIKFKKYNRGQWLSIVATGNDPSTGLGSIYLEGDNEIQMRTPFMFLEGDDSAPFRIYQYTLFDVQVDAINLLGTPGGVSIYGDEGGVFMQVAKNGSGGLSIQGADGTLYATIDPGGQMHLRAGMPILYDLP